MNYKRNAVFLYEIGTLRLVQRTWRQFLAPHVANVSEHTLRVLWIALTLASYEEKVNTEKLMKMALIHDVPEVRTGDCHYVARYYTNRNDNSALQDILSDTVFQAELFALWVEFEQRESKEAKIVRDADSLDVDLEIMEQSSQGNSFKENWYEFRKAKIFPTLYTQTAKELWCTLYAVNPSAWHTGQCSLDK